MTKKASAYFIFATILLDAMGIGVIIPVLPDILRRFNNDASFVNLYFGFFMASYAAMQFLASPVLGSLSDRFGRRPILLSSLCGAALDYTLMAFAPTLGLLFLGRIISGLTGASMTVASSYMADISDDKNRSANFGLIGAGWGFGFILGPLLGGFLGSQGAQAPFLAAAGLNFINFIFGLFILPESLPKEKRRKIELKNLNPFRSLFKFLTHSEISRMMICFFLMFLAGQVHPSIWTLYTEYKFHWTPFEVGLSLTFVGLSLAIVNGGLTRVLIPKWGELRAVKIGLFVQTLGFLGYALATMGWMVYVIVGFSALGGIAGPSIQSLITQRISPSEQGELQGTIMSLGSLTAIISPLMYTNSFNHFTQSVSVQIPGFPYFLSAFICLSSLLIFLASKNSRMVKKENS